jgi:hypothetical protein
MTKILLGLEGLLTLPETSSLRGLPIGSLKEMFDDGKPKQTKLPGVIQKLRNKLT